MRLVLFGVAVLSVVGCASSSPARVRTPEQHAANIAAAETAGYKVIKYGDRAVFCPSDPKTGSHIGSMCLSEGEWEAQAGLPRVASPSAHVTNQVPGPGPGAGH